MKCRPLYLQRELNKKFIAIVYVPPGANVNEAIRELHDVISELLSKHLGSSVVNCRGLQLYQFKDPQFKQCVDVKTRGEKLLILMYTKAESKFFPYSSGFSLSFQL